MASKSSTTPKADKEAALHKLYDKSCDFVSVTEVEFARAKCKKCNGRFKPVMSAYAMSKGENDWLMYCGCDRPMLWMKRIEK